MSQNQNEAIGELYLLWKEELAKHLQTIEVLRQVVDGTLDRSRVVLAGQSWTILPKADPPPAAPATEAKAD